jgi:hypothetical protein
MACRAPSASRAGGGELRIFGVSTWTYVHRSHDWNAAGWMSDYYLSNGGALTRC